ncbi:MAG TPA: RNA methyltransferase [Gemmataceae bacterium]|jgi:TrmH family RNA methyltransferase|nr:RNA methyltransferase [Gemmataceae bacterium]
MAMPPRKITSVANELVKQWASLRDAKHRHRERLFVLEGTRLVDEALKSSLEVVAVCSSDSAWIKGLQVSEACVRFEVTDAIVAKCSSTETPQTAFAVAALPSPRTDFPWETIEIALLLDRIQDPGNMGAAIRAAAAVGVDVVVIGDGCVDLYAPKTLRAAMGATFRVPVVHRDLKAVLPKLRRADCRIFASALTEDATDLFQLRLRSTKVAWIVGNEGNGIGDSLLSEVDAIVTIPMLRQTESLNVAQATAVLLYESARQKKSLTP